MTVSGDNTDAAGYVPGEAVHVDASGPAGYGLSCDATADDTGAWACGLTLAPDAPVGDYSYAATAATSNVSEAGTFTVSAPVLTGLPWVQTDQADYNAGGTVTLTGGDWQPDETVQVAVNDEQGQTWNLQDTVQADDSGAITYQFQLPNWFVATYSVTAAGLTSGSVAEATFTDTVASINPTQIGEGAASFPLIINGAGFGSNSQVTWTPTGGSATTLARTVNSSSKITATVPASLVANEGTAAVRVTTQGAGGPITFTINEQDSFTLAPATITAKTNNAFSGKVATLTDSFDNQNPSEFVATINWGDNTGASTGTVTRTGAGTYDVTGSHTYASQFVSTSVKTGGVAYGATTVPVANNGTTNFANSGAIVIFTGSGYETLSYTGKTGGTSASFTGVSGWGAGGGTIPAGNPITGPYSVSVTVTDPSPGTATATTSSPTQIADGISYALTASNFTTTEGTVYTDGAFFPGSIGTSVFPNVGEYRLHVQAGAQSAWYTLYTSGPNNYMYPNSTTGSLSFPEEGSVPYTDTLYRNNGDQVATDNNGTITVADAQLSWSATVGHYSTLIGVPTGPILVGKFFDGLTGDNHADFTVTVHWGDGQTDANVPIVWVAPNGYTISASHTYSQVGTYNVSYTAADDGGQSVSVNPAAVVTVTAPLTQTVVTASPNPSTYGQPVTFTATVTNSTTPAAPTGNVEVYDGSTDLGPGAFVSSSGNQSSWTFATKGTALGAGSHQIKASFSSQAFATSSGTMTQTVNQKGLVITASSASVIYGDPVPTITPSYTGFVGTDDASNSLSTPPTCTTAYTQGSGVGGSPYGTKCQDAVSANYSPSYQPGSVTVGQATLTVTAENKSHQYSDSPPALTYKISGFLVGDTQAVVAGTASCSTGGTQWVQAGQYPITCAVSGLSAANYKFTPAPGTMPVTQEDAAVQYTGDTIAQVGTNLSLRATVWDSAAAGFPGTSTGPIPDTTIGDVSKIWIAFDLYPASSCLTGTPTTKYAQVSDTGTAGDGIGTASATYSSSSEASFCVVSRLVASGSGGTNLWYAAPDGEAAGIDFYVNSGQFATGGGWINDPAGGKGNYGFNARYNNSGKPQGQFVYVYRGSYNGVAADFVIKSSALSALQFAGSNYPISATLQGKAVIQINRAGDGVQLYNDGNGSFTATVVDSGQSSGIGSDSLALAVYDKNGVTYRAIPASLLGGGNVVVHLK